jgi:NodT family efflux transporter outer membrane factor (OMF) lipoprotein
MKKHIPSPSSSLLAIDRLMPVATILLAAALLSACSGLVRTPYVAPATAVPANWFNEYSNTRQNSSSGNWWQHFGDADLDRLIEEALRRNNNLAAATIKVRRAQLTAGISGDARMPSLSSSTSTTYNRYLRNDRSSSKTSSTTLSLSYEADLWGKLGSQYDALTWEAIATEQDRASTALALIGTTADLYWQIAYLNQRLTLSADSIAYAEKTLALVRTQYQAGYVSSLEVLTAEQNLATQQSSRTDLLQQLVEARNSLALLFDGPPGVSFADPQRLPEQALPPLQAGLPAELLGRRPDLRAAELRLRESLATVDATRASYYPSLTLTATAGGSSSDLHNVLLNPIGTLGAGLVLPFLQWNQMQLNIKVSQADYESAVVTFRQTLYTALADVENALSARTQYAEQGALLEKNLRAARAAERLYEWRYRSGYIALSLWLDAQEARRTAEVALAENRYNRLLNQMTLYQALGGDTPALAVASDNSATVTGNAGQQ